MLDSFDVPPPVPVRVLDAGTYDALMALTDADRAWLDEMAEGLPDSMPVDGSSWWLMRRVDPMAVAGFRLPRRFPAAPEPERM